MAYQWLIEMYDQTKKAIQKRHYNTINKSQDHEQYKTYRNTLKKIIRRAKEAYYKEQCQNFKKKHNQIMENDKQNY